MIVQGDVCPPDDKRLVPMQMLVLLRCSAALSLHSVCDCVTSKHSQVSSSLRLAVVDRLG
jgi:hypothetical protein